MNTLIKIALGGAVVGGGILLYRRFSGKPPAQSAGDLVRPHLPDIGPVTVGIAPSTKLAPSSRPPSKSSGRVETVTIAKHGTPRVSPIPKKTTAGAK